MLSLTIVIPTKDRPGFLHSATLAALADLPQNSCVIVVDDHGTKPAKDALADITDPRLKVLPNSGPRGPSSARNFGVAQAETDLIVFADDDDLLAPGYVSHVAQMAQTARYGFCATQTFSTPPSQTPAFQAQQNLLLDTLPFRKQLGGLGCGFWIYRRDFHSVGGINPALRVNEDTDFSIRLLAANLTGNFQTGTGVLIRQHLAAGADGNLGQITKRANAAARAGYFATIIADNAAYLARRPAAKRYLTKRQVKMHAKAGQFRAGINACRSAPSLLGYFALNYIISRVRAA